MKFRNNQLIALILPIAGMILFQSCDTLTYYHPDKSFHPLMKEKGDMQVEIGTSKTEDFRLYGINGGYAVSKHSIIFGTINGGTRTDSRDSILVNVSGDTNEILEQRNMSLQYQTAKFNLGYSFYYPFAKHFILAAKAGIGVGTLNYYVNEKDKDESLNGKRETVNSNFILGPSLAFVSKNFSVSVAADYINHRFMYVKNEDIVVHGTGKKYETDFNPIKEKSALNFIQPSAQVTLGFENYRLYANYTANTALSEPGFQYNRRNISFGLILTP